MAFRSLTLGLALALGCSAFAAGAPDSLKSEFQTPPDSAKPRVWWHWMSGNVTKEGITADLEWFKRTGIGGFQMFDAYLSVPQFVDHRVVWYTPEWRDDFRHAAAEANRLGLEMAMAGSGGWSETGGPSVTPQQAMKKVVWSETPVTGGQHFSGRVPTPPTNNGTFQDAPTPGEPARVGTTGIPGAKPTPPPAPAKPDPTFYSDIAVLAYRVPDTDLRMTDAHPKITWNGRSTDLAGLTDGSYARNVTLPYPASGDGELTFEFSQPFHAEAFTLASVGATRNSQPVLPGRVQASQDGTHWQTILTLPAPVPTQRPGVACTYNFVPVTARFFRVEFTRPPEDPQAAVLAMLGHRDNADAGFPVAEVEFHSTARTEHWQEKAGYGLAMDYGTVDTPAVPATEVVAPADIVDLTAKLQQDGTLDWDAPPGRWVIARFGYSLTGKKNHPATPEATGFEVDKLNRDHVRSYFDHYVSQAAAAAGEFWGKSFRYLLLDSWEAGTGNWTDDMPAQFRAHRGYDLLKWLPALTGRIVGSADQTDRFLWDWRRTIADLVAENHYAAAAEYLHQHGAGLYAEAVGTNRPTLADGLQDKGRADIPMGEFWTPAEGETEGRNYVADVREAASAGHIYGRQIVAAESFTSRPNVVPWGEGPFELKALGDRNLARGINRIVFHTSDHQPFVDAAHKPGMTLWQFGQHYSRNITWAEQAVTWNTYLARCSFLLQQGLNVADIAYFYGEGAPAVVPYWKEQHPAVPPGYSYDYFNAEVLLTRASVKNGRIVLPDGMSYRVLVVPRDKNRLSLPVLRKIRDLVAAGATVVAPRPISSPSLTDYPACDDEVRAIAADVWGPINGVQLTENAYRAGHVYWGMSLEKVLAAQAVAPDFQHTSPALDTKLAWIHRHTPEAEIYFVANQNNRAEQLDAVFRVNGRDVELWHPDTGETEPASYSTHDGKTTVPLAFDPCGSLFVIFRGSATAPSRELPHPHTTVLATIEGPWTVNFPPNLGAPASTQLDRLASWTTQSDPGVKYFSGTATYVKTVEVPAQWLQSGARVKLDLGAVKEIAEVSVNGTPASAILWKPPFAVDVTRLLKPGQNQLEIKVTNLWPNRIIGDQALPVEQRHSWTVYHAFTKDSPLLESGLLGPVTMLSVR
jgi:hypothetical protein